MIRGPVASGIPVRGEIEDVVRIILFDIDGTLILSGGAGLRALRRVFRERYGIDDAVDGIEFHGRTDPQIVASIAGTYLGRTLEDSETREVTAAYLLALEESLHDGRYRVLDGARELLHELSARDDVLLGLATGNVEPGAWAKLRRGHLDGFFSFGGFGSDSPDRDTLTRLAVSRGRDRLGQDAPAIVIGDTIHDVRSARAAGADCLAVSTGNASLAALEAAGARWALPSLADPRTLDVLAPD